MSFFTFSKNLINKHRPFIKNLNTFKSGDCFYKKCIVSEELVKAFIAVSGDNNPIHKISHGNKPLVHGALLNSLVSAVIGTKLPGPGSIVIKQELNFPSPCYIGDEIEIQVSLQEVRKIILVNYVCKTVSSESRVVMNGNAKIMMKKNL